MQNYYYQPTNLWRKLRCTFRLIPLMVGLGHDFEIQYTEERKWEPHTDFRVGEQASVCRLCFLVEDRRDYRVLPEVVYGSSPSSGRRLEQRQVDHLPIAPDGQESLCGKISSVHALGLRCRKFAWHNYSSNRSMRTHDGSRPAPGGQYSYMWDDDPKEVTA